MNKPCFMTNLTSAEWAAWVQAVGTVGLVLIGVLTLRHQAILTRERDDRIRRETLESEERRRAERLSALWSAVRAEVETCGNMAVAFLAAHIMAPSYRLPTVAYRTILPELLLAARLSTTDTQDLLSFFVDVEALNRGLDIAQEIAQEEDNQRTQQRLARRHDTNENRATEHLRPGGDHYQAAMTVIERHTGPMAIS